MTRPEDVALLRRMADYFADQWVTAGIDTTNEAFFAEANALCERLASRLEGEGRDGERLDWLDRRGVTSIYFEDGGQMNPASMEVRSAIDAALQSPALQSAAPASCNQPTTTTEEHEP